MGKLILISGLLDQLEKFMQDSLNNPQTFMEQCVKIIKNNRHALAIDGIKYVKLDGKEYYAQEIFDSSELVANLDKNAVKVDHSVYDHIIYDSSTIEKPFALALDNDPDVKMFFKIPDRFKIDHQSEHTIPTGLYFGKRMVNRNCISFLKQKAPQVCLI